MVIYLKSLKIQVYVFKMFLNILICLVFFASSKVLKLSVTYEK